MERNQAASDDHADYYGSVKMNQIEEALNGLLMAIKGSDEYVRYQKIQQTVNELPELSAQIDTFRKRVYLLQNSHGKVDVYDETDRIGQEYRDFRKNPIVAEYLAAESALCRVIQQINWTLIEELDFEAGFVD